MSVLAINDETRAEIKRVVDYANEPANYFRAKERKFIPGDRPEYVANLQSYRCVFTITTDEGHFYRHLTVSLRKPKKPNLLPSAPAVCAIADLFGFTGWGGLPAGPPANWGCAPLENPCPHVVVIEEIFQ
jgi:hypothetical protein